ncbi:hypothetical protein ACFL1H_05455 [Nanoarchaeota archaeon]
MKMKKGWIRTVEVTIAIVIVLAFMISIVPTPQQRSLTNFNLLQSLENNDIFRNCLIEENNTCIYNIIDERLIDSYNFNFTITNSTDITLPNLPDKDITSESLVISGNETYYNPLIIRLWYWRS